MFVTNFFFWYKNNEEKEGGRETVYNDNMRDLF